MMRDTRKFTPAAYGKAESKPLPAESSFNMVRRMRLNEDDFVVLAKCQDAMNKTDWRGEKAETIRLRHMAVGAMDEAGFRTIRFKFERASPRAMTFYNSQLQPIGETCMEAFADFNAFDFGDPEP